MERARPYHRSGAFLFSCEMKWHTGYPPAWRREMRERICACFHLHCIIPWLLRTLPFWTIFFGARSPILRPKLCVLITPAVKAFLKITKEGTARERERDEFLCAWSSGH